ncbi:MAG: hypothetical protein ACOC1D_00585 [Prolixibacteraceae bacterium]
MKQSDNVTIKIVFYFLILLFVYNCKARTVKGNSDDQKKKPAHQMQLTPEVFIPELPHELSENSGLLVYDNLFWTFNDSGGLNVVYGLNAAGEIVKHVEITDAENRDWEDIAQDDDFIYIGDFGNNNGVRKDLVVYKIKKADIGTEPVNEVKAKKVEFKFADQKKYRFLPQSSAFDCEALAERNGNLYIFTKDWKNETTTVYHLPKSEGNYALQPIDSFQVNALITGADFSPDQTKLALVGYHDFKPLLRIFSGVTNEKVFGEKSIFIAMDSIAGAQTEGICFLSNDTLLISCESTFQFGAQVFRVDLNKLR